MAKKNLSVQGTQITLINQNDEDFISLTEMTTNFGGSEVIKAWLRNRQTIEFLGVWESLNNPAFNWVEFDPIKNASGSNKFVISVKEWIDKTGAVGITAKSGRYGGTYAHKDIAFEFGSWLSPEFKLYLIKEFQRLKDEESKRLQAGWDIKRTLSKLNYRIQTDAVKRNLVPPELASKQQGLIYASEADVLNEAVFGITAREWRLRNPGTEGNIRDCAEVEQLVVLANLESINAMLIDQGLPQHERALRLNQLAITQLQSLTQRPATPIKADPIRFNKALGKAAPPVQEPSQKSES
jgi:hypothetical protein